MWLLKRLNDICIISAIPILLFCVGVTWVLNVILLLGNNYIPSEKSLIPTVWGVLLTCYAAIGIFQRLARHKTGTADLSFVQSMKFTGPKQILKLFGGCLIFVSLTTGLTVPALHTAVFGKAGSQTYQVNKTNLRGRAIFCYPSMSIKTDRWVVGTQVCDLSDYMAENVRKGDAITVYGRSSAAGVFYNHVAFASADEIHRPSSGQ